MLFIISIIKKSKNLFKKKSSENLVEKYNTTKYVLFKVVRQSS